MDDPVAATLTSVLNRFKPVLAKRVGLALALWGDAGVGKSHQAERLLQTLTCHSSSLHATLSLASLVQRLSRPKKLPLWANQTLARLAKGEEVESASAIASLGAVFAGLAPFVLHLEDLHEAGQERLEFVRDLARVVIRTKGASLVITSRREPPEPFTPVQLLPLATEASRELLTRALGTQPPLETANWIYGKAAGNPLYTLEYLRYLTKQGFLWSDGKHWHWRTPHQDAMPTTIEALIEQLVDQARAEPLHRYVLETKAVLPRDAKAEVWSQVARVTNQELQAALKELAQQGLFRENDFAHPLFGEVVLKTMGTERKRNLARRALAVLENEPEQAALFVDDAGLEPAAALALLKRAAEQAKQRSEVGAARLLAKAVVYAAEDEKGQLAFRAAQTLGHSNVVEAEQLFEMAAKDTALRSQALFQLAELLATQGRSADAKRVLERLAPAERTGPEWISRLVQIYSAANDDAGVLELVRAHPEVLEHADALTLSRIVRALAHDGRLSEGEALVNRRLEHTFTPKDRIYLLKALSVIAYMRADFITMEELETNIYNLAQPLGDLRLLDAALFNRAIALGNLGRYQEQKASLEAALEVCRDLGDVSALVIAQMAYADTLIEVADYEEAETLLLEARAVLSSIDLSAFLVGCEASLAKLYEAWQPPQGKLLALKHATASLKEARKRNTVHLLIEGLCALARAEAWAGNAQRAESLALEAVERTQSLEVPAARLNALDARARSLLAAGNTKIAEQLFAEALGLAQELSNEATVQYTALELDRLNNDVARARERMKWFEKRGLLNGVTVAKRYFLELEGAKTDEIAEAQPRLEVLGRVQLSHKGTTVIIRGRKRQELLTVLLEARLAGRGGANALELCEALYAEENETNAQKSLKQLVFQTRTALGQSLITTTPNGYALGQAYSDAESFLEGGDTPLWRGPYLANVGVHDEAVRDTLYTALKARMAELVTQRPTEAVRVGGLLLGAEPYDLGALTLTLRALRQTGDAKGLEQLYRRGREQLAEVGELLPESWQIFLEQVSQDTHL